MKCKLLPLPTRIINGGGTINSVVNRRGSLGPQASSDRDHFNSPILCDSSQILASQLHQISDTISSHLAKVHRLIFMMGTDTVGQVGDALTHSISEDLLTSKQIVLAAAMKPDHKDEVLSFCKQV